MAKITIIHIIQKVFILLLTLTFVQAEKTAFIQITNFNGGNSVTPGQSISFKFKIIHTPSPEDNSFDLVLKNDSNTVFAKLITVSSDDYQFNKDNEYKVENVIIPSVSDGKYKLYGYVGNDKVSESYSVSVKTAKITTKEAIITITTKSIEPVKTSATSQPSGTPKPSESINPEKSENTIITSNSTQPNISISGEYNNGNSNSSFNWKTFNWKSAIIVGSIILVILIIFGILLYCCIKDSKRKRDDSIYKLPPAVSEPHLVSSSSPIKAIPLQYKNNINNININENKFSSPIISPIVHSNSNYSDIYNQETQGLTQTTKVNNIATPANAYVRDTIYSNNSAYISHDSIAPEDDMSSPSPSYYFQVFKPHQVYRVLYDFEPSLADEMAIQAGDIVRTEETFEDGWAYGINMSTGKKGTFPMNCLEDDFATDADSRSAVSERSQSHNRRTSSLPNNQNSQIIQMMLDNNSNNNSQSFQKSYYTSQVNNMKV
ncbi:hypothetical protein BCR36DRAFT_414610 [Piromyces finnis]|uniref:SH3 domain-containing protein n=1 Tax=Piromyces finnis TaxID=1754191 RepID=A0A1Y1V2G8_9FUNG|nr:hypothetical protein BCR36DRAFT_414610 [Piromyces finnis]|eukprot:ORX45146.1 hypothetical protein BCR36DRAFT_414610 [Piromyces finnis]